MCGVVAEGRTAHPRDQRHKALESVLEALGIEHLQIPSTKVDPIQTEVFYVEILERLATSVVILEALAKRADGLADLLAYVAERVEKSEENMDTFGEALASLVNKEVRRLEREAEVEAEGEADEAKADDSE